MTDSAKAFRCEIAGHDGSDISKYFPKIIDYEEANRIAKLHAPTAQTPLDTHYICYANPQRNGRNAVLGYGIQVENAKLGSLYSPCEYLSLNSFKGSNIRKSSTNLRFSEFLPILIDQKNWNDGLNIKRVFQSHVNEICTRINFNGQEHEKVFKVCSSLMNSLVVEIMKNEGNATANDKFINGYFSIYRLLLEYAKSDKNLLTQADFIIEKYVNKGTPPNKNNVPNLGEFLIYTTISKKYGWKDICGIFMRQRFMTVARNLWESGMLDSTEDNAWNFHKYGLLPEEVRSELISVYKAITEIQTWKGVFEWLGMNPWDDEERGRELEKAMRLSASRGYHR